MKFEYHIPREYSSTRPGFVYRTTEHNETMVNNHLASKLPRGGSYLEVFGTTKDLAPLACASDNPSRLEDRALTDLPPMFIHHINFTDGTLLAISLPHTFMDIGAFKAVLQGWAAVLNGREDQVPKMRDLADDPRIALAQRTSGSEYVFQRHLRSRLQSLAFSVRSAATKLWTSKKETRMICLPGDFIKTLKEKALHDLESQPTAKGQTGSYLSDNDVMLAWYTRIMLAVFDPSPSRPLMISNSYDVRPVCLPKDSSCLLDCSFCLRTATTVQEAVKEPLGLLAAQIRLSLVQQRTPEQTEAYAALARETVEATGDGPSFGASNTFSLFWTNDDAGRLFHLDFSSAVRNPGPLQDRKNDVIGRPSLVMDITDMSNIGDIAIVLGRDHSGNWWMGRQMSVKHWEKVKKQFEVINMERKGEKDPCT
jgi:hypothetical protein